MKDRVTLTRKSPELYRWAASCLGLGACAVAYVSDHSDAALEAARGAGLATVLVTREFPAWVLGVYTGTTPDAVVQEVPELITLLVETRGGTLAGGQA